MMLFDTPVKQDDCYSFLICFSQLVKIENCPITNQNERANERTNERTKKKKRYPIQSRFVRVYEFFFLILLLKCMQVTLELVTSTFHRLSFFFSSSFSKKKKVYLISFNSLLIFVFPSFKTNRHTYDKTKERRRIFSSIFFFFCFQEYLFKMHSYNHTVLFFYESLVYIYIYMNMCVCSLTLNMKSKKKTKATCRF